VLGSATGISLPGAVAFVLLAVALMTVRPGVGLMELATSPSPGGHTVRRLVVPSIVVPILIGWVVRRGEELDLYEQVQTLSVVGAHRPRLHRADGVVHQRGARHRRWPRWPHRPPSSPTS
jgi:hypothetical protein